MAAGSSYKILNVAEKNDAAKALSNIMAGGRARRREGFSKYNKIYEFDFNILGRNSHMIMTSVSGHLLALDFALAYKNWNSCPPDTLFTASVQYYCPESNLPIKRTLQKEIRGCQHLILWTDGDREGENIADEIAEVVSEVKSRGLSVHRARFSEITHQSVMNACSNLQVLDQRVSDAVKTRKELDLRIGAAFTRFQTKLLTKAFPSVLSEQLVSYGPCQFPTLGFVVERYNQIQAFIPETFYKIKVTHEVCEDKVEFSWERGRIFHHAACLVLYQLCLENPTAHVLGTTSRPRSKWRPLPLDTVELEKLGSRKLKINAKETMRLAEKLYTQGFISYPRTETNMFPESFDLRGPVQQQSVDPQWGEFASRLLTVGPTPRQGSKTDNAHPPIYPTKYTNTLEGNEKKIYELVVRHFLACCSQDAKGQEMKVEIDIAGEKFTAQALAILERNYLDVYPYDKWNAKVIPSYATGSSFQPTSIEMVDGETTPPPLLQEADLIGLMDKHGIGTDATHAEHIETIKTRNYVGVQPDGGFVPGELGMGLVEGYDSMGYELSKPHLRAELEMDLKRICEGNKSKEDVLAETVQKYKQVFLNAKAQAQHLEQALSTFFGQPQSVPMETEATPIISESVRKCPQCKQNDLIIKKKKDGGYMLSCLGFPQCRTVQFFPKFVIEAALHHSMCLTCQPQPVHKLLLKFKEGCVPPYVGVEVVACTTCDQVLKEELGFAAIKVTQPPPGQGGGASTGRGRGRGGARGGALSARGNGTGSSSSRGRGGARGGALSARGNGTGSRGRGGALSTRGNGIGSSSSRGRGGARGRASSAMGRGGGGSSSHDMGPGRGGASSSHDTGWGGRGGTDGEGLGDNRDYWGDVGSNGSEADSGFNSNASMWSSNTYGAPAGSSRPSSAAGFSSSLAEGQGTNNPTTCNCGQEAILLTVRKEDSTNKGRQFYKCPRPQGTGCDFFLWADQLAPATPTSYFTSGAQSTYQPGTQSTYQPGTQSTCQPGTQSTYQPGTQSTCQPGTQSTYQPGTQSTYQPGFLATKFSRGGQRGGARGRGRGGVASDSISITLCNCEEEAVLRTVQKEGPNKGKQFYTCPKPREHQCRFFEWADSVPASSVRHYSARGGRGRGERGRGGANSWRMTSGVGADADSGEGVVKKKRAPPTCSVCREVGHTKRSCPQLKL